MPIEIYYDRRSLTATKEQQFFYESRAKHTDKEIGTNMPKDSEFGKDVVIKKIICFLEPLLKNSDTAKDTALFGDLLTVLSEGVIQIQSGNGTINYYPLVNCLGKSSVIGDAEYTLATAANGSYGIISLQSITNEAGLDVDIPVPKDLSLKFYLKTKTTVTLANVKMILEVEVR